MAQQLLPMNATPTGMRLTEWVAHDRGLFEEEGLDVTVDWDVLKRQQSRHGDPADKDFDDLGKQRLGQFLPKSEMTTACAWGTIVMAGAGMGKIIPDVHGVAPCGVYVRADSPIRQPEDLKDVPIAVGIRAGSHFSLLAHLEKHLPLKHINAVNHGGFGRRLQVLMDGTVEAASLLPPQNYMAEQLGFRCVLGGEFWTGWWVNDDADPEKIARYLRAIERAEDVLDNDLAANLHLWKNSNPPEFADHDWDYSTFGRGERFVRSPIGQTEFDKMLDDAHRWGLDNHMTERSYDRLFLAAE